MEPVLTLNGIVHTRFGSVADFARALGWSYSKTNRAVRNSDSVTLADARKMADVLRLEDPDIIVRIFF